MRVGIEYAEALVGVMSRAIGVQMRKHLPPKVVLEAESYAGTGTFAPVRW